MAITYVDPKEYRTKKAEKTGVYVGPGSPDVQDSRYYKAGADIPATYTFARPLDTRGYRAPIKDPNVVEITRRTK